MEITKNVYLIITSHKLCMHTLSSTFDIHPAVYGNGISWQTGNAIRGA